MNAPYAKKWRVLLAVLLGATLIGVCILGFYISVQARKQQNMAAEVKAFNASSTPKPPPPPPRRPPATWRGMVGCLSTTPVDTCPEDYNFRPLLVIGVDGLRPDKIGPEVTPALWHMAGCGVQAKSLVPVYPTTTFPNFYSIATGLYPESHGVIGNEMHEAGMNFTGRSRLNPHWWHGEPIWNTATKEGKKSAIYFWPGSDVYIQESYPTYYYQYRKDEPIELRTTQVLQWLSLPKDERPHLLMVYFEKPMSAIQEFGPDSTEAQHSLHLVDEAIDNLMQKLHNLHLAHCLNILVVSDHGAENADCGLSSFYLESFTPDIKEKARIYTGAVGRLSVREGKGTEEEILKTAQCKNPKVRVLTKDLLPRRYHYANNIRIEDIILDTKPSNRVVTRDDRYCKKGEHGYNNLAASMQATFLGFGPDLKVNYTSHSFRNIELYNLMCHLTNIKPAHNNGTERSLDHLLRQTPLDGPLALNLLEEELLLPPVKVPIQESSDTADLEEPCICDYVEPLEVELDYVTSNISINGTNGNFTANGNNTVNSTEILTLDETTTAISEEEISTQLLHNKNYHVPWGSPGYSAPDKLDGKLKVLLHTNYVIGLHELLSLGVWVSFTITGKAVEQVEAERPRPPEGIEIKPEDIKKNEKSPPCWRADDRLERLLEDQCDRLLTAQSYQDQNISLLQLFPEELETEELLASEGHLLSNLAPARAGYKNGARNAMLNAIEFWAKSRGSINVVHGPIYDYDLDGRQDNVSTVLNTVKPLVPSDYFFVVCACNSGDNASVTNCPSNATDVLAFIFPNSNIEDNCYMSDKEYLEYHLTTVRDVELLTGLRFFKRLLLLDSLPLRTVQPISVWPIPTERTGKSNEEIKITGI